MSEQEQRGGQPESTDENAPAPTERAATGVPKKAGENGQATRKTGGTEPAKK
jgi:hypothetical protein